MILKSIETDGNAIRLTFENGETLRVRPETALRLSLTPGESVSEDDLCTLRADAGRLSARKRAAAIVSAVPISERELQRRLVQKGETAEHACEAVRWLSDLQLLDDRELARRLMENAAAKGYGRARIIQIFIKKGIGREYWEEALSACPDGSDALDEFLQKRLRGIRPDFKERKRAADALIRRGHTWEDISSALSRYERMLDEEAEAL